MMAEFLAMRRIVLALYTELRMAVRIYPRPRSTAW